MKKWTMAILCCLPMLVYAESLSSTPQWKKLGENGNGSAFYIEMGHAITQQDNTAWVKADLGFPIPMNGKVATFMVSKAEFDCENKMFRRTHNYFFTENQVNVGQQVELDAPFEEIVPGSFDDMVREMACMAVK